MKKVLISLDDINEIENKAYISILNFIEGSPPLAGLASFEIAIKKWFDAQPDITPILNDYNAAKDFFKGAIPRLDEEIAKLEESIST